MSGKRRCKSPSSKSSLTAIDANVKQHENGKLVSPSHWGQGNHLFTKSLLAHHDAADSRTAAADLASREL